MVLVNVRPWLGLLLVLLAGTCSVPTVTAFAPILAAATTIARPPKEQDTLITSAFVEPATAIPTKDVVTRVAVAGATGRTGRYVVEELINRGVTSVVAIVRDTDKAAEVFPNPPANLEIMQCDLSNEKEIAAVLKDVDASIWCATGFSDAPTGRSVNVFQKLQRLFGMVVTPNKSIDVIGLPAFSKAMAQNNKEKADTDASRLKLPKLVMCSSAGVTRTTWSKEKKEKFAGCADIPIVRLNPFGILDRKRESEVKLREISSDNYCIVRPCGLNDQWPAGSRPMLSQGDVAVGRLNRKDLATVLVDVLSAPEATGKTFEVVGIAGYPRPLSLRPALARLYQDGQAPNVPSSMADELLFATYTTMQQLLPGEKQDAAALAMGQTYEQLDQGTTGRLGERGKEDVDSVAPIPPS